ncbi:MAG: cadherin-like domain-containing protein [Pirellulaceae bacterium]
MSLTEDSVFQASFVESILANDMDADGQALSVTILSEPDVGSLMVEEGGWRFIPPTDFVGQTSFTYSVSDGVDESAVAEVTLLVTAVNDARLCLKRTLRLPAKHYRSIPLRGIWPTTDVQPNVDGSQHTKESGTRPIDLECRRFVCLCAEQRIRWT